MEQFIATSNIFIITIKDGKILRAYRQFIQDSNNTYSMIRDLDFSFRLEKDERVRFQIRRMNNGIKWSSIGIYDTLDEYDCFSSKIFDYIYNHRNFDNSIIMQNDNLMLEIPQYNNVYSCPIIIFK